MDLSLSPDQQELIASFRGLLTRISPEDVVRAAEPLGFDADVWNALREQGVVHMAVAESTGGWGATSLDLCLVAACLGEAAAPAPVVECQVAARLLSSLGDDGAGMLTDALAGEKIVTLALHAPVDGVARVVPAGAVADIVLVLDGDRLVAVEVCDSSRQHLPNVGAMPLADVATADASVIASGAGVSELHAAAVDEWLLYTGAALTGLGQTALKVAVEYACEREAFGRQIGSFQAISHRLADAATLLAGSELFTWEAAWLRDQARPDVAERAASSFAFATEAADHATYWSVHTLGGYGVMLEYSPQLYFRRARGWSRVFGDADAGYLRASRHRYRQRRGD